MANAVPRLPRRGLGTVGRAGQPSRHAAGWAAAGLLLLFCCSPALGSDLTAVGGWSRTVNSGDLAAGAGSNLLAAYESAAGASTVDISNTGGAGWRVDIRRSDGNWDSHFTLSVRRTSDGAGAGSVSGGDAYQAVGTNDTTLFTGVANRSGVDLQYRLSGMSVSVPPGSYTTTVILTVGAP